MASAANVMFGLENKDSGGDFLLGCFCIFQYKNKFYTKQIVQRVRKFEKRVDLGKNCTFMKVFRSWTISRESRPAWVGVKSPVKEQKNSASSTFKLGR